jgi:hypothetical protein
MIMPLPEGCIQQINDTIWLRLNNQGQLLLNQINKKEPTNILYNEIYILSNIY